jgi:hypothetical protein
VSKWSTMTPNQMPIYQKRKGRGAHHQDGPGTVSRRTPFCASSSKVMGEERNDDNDRNRYA